MGTVPVVEGEIEGGPIDPSKMSHDDIRDLALRYREATKIIDQQKRLMAEANRVIMKLQAAIRELRGETNVKQSTEGADALPAQHSDAPPEGNEND